MSRLEVTQLGHLRLNGGEELHVRLLRPANIPAAERTLKAAMVHIVWPPMPTAVNPDHFGDVANQIARTFAAASTELAAYRARHRGLL